MNKRIKKRLIELAKTVDPVQNARVVAALVWNRKIISIGINQKKSHTLQALYGRNPESIYLHAEVDAIRRARYHPKLHRSKLYVVRVRSNGKTALAKPCKGCQKLLNELGIKYEYTR